MMPFYPSPLGDDGYDITDYYAVDSRFGTLGNFVEMIRTADNLGIRVLVDLVLSHTSNQHPWFQRSRQDRSSRYRDYYRWSDTNQDEPREVAFPGEQKSTWTYDNVAVQWYMHRYHDFMPDLNITDPNVLDDAQGPRLVAGTRHLRLPGRLAAVHDRDDRHPRRSGPGRAAGAGRPVSRAWAGFAFHYPVPAAPVAGNGLDQVEPGVYRFEQRPVALFAGSQ